MDEARQLPGRAAIRMQIRGGADARCKLQPGARTPDRKITTARRYDRAALPTADRKLSPLPGILVAVPTAHPRPSPSALTGTRGGAARAAAPLPHAAAAPTSAAGEGGGTEGRSAARRRAAARLPARSLCAAVGAHLGRRWRSADGLRSDWLPRRGGTICAGRGERRPRPLRPAPPHVAPPPRRAAAGGAGAGSAESFRTSLRARVIPLSARIASLRCWRASCSSSVRRGIPPTPAATCGRCRGQSRALLSTAQGRSAVPRSRPPSTPPAALGARRLLGARLRVAAWVRVLLLRSSSGFRVNSSDGRA